MEARLDKVQSHGVTLGYNGSGGHGLQDEKEEAYAYLTVNVRGEDREVRVSMDRYRHTGGMSAWRWYVTDIDPGDGIGPSYRAKVREAVAPLIDGWLAGIYGTNERGELGMNQPSRARAYRYALIHEIRNMRTVADYRARDAMQKFGCELTGKDETRLADAYASMETALRLLDFTVTGDNG